MRIAQITESLEVGGAERIVVALANALAARHESSVVCLKRPGELTADLLPTVNVTCIGKHEGTDPLAVWRLASLLRARNVQAVHTHDWGVFLDAAVAARIAGVTTLVHTVHGRYMAYRSGRLAALKKAARHWLERMILRAYGNVVCVSDAMRPEIVAEVGIPSERVQTIPNGIVAEAPMKPRGSFRCAGTRFVTVARLAAVKDLDTLIRALAVVLGRCPDARLLIIGDGPERERLQLLTRELGIGASVEFLGFRSDAPAVLASCDVYVLSSVSEGLPLSVLEAMRAALPVVATRVGGVSAAVLHGETGWLVDAKDSAALAQAMMSLAENPAHAEAMGAAGRQRVRAHFSFEAMVAAYERLYGDTCIASTIAAGEVRS